MSSCYFCPNPAASMLRGVKLCWDCVEMFDYGLKRERAEHRERLAKD